jgi:ABC-type multidrug transport system ATPase subunit
MYTRSILCQLLEKPLLSPFHNMEEKRAGDVESGIVGPEEHTILKPSSTVCDSLGNDIRLRAVSPVNIQVRNLSVRVESSKDPPWSSLAAAKAWLWSRNEEGRPKIILNDVSANMPSGSLTAIIGASGSGKTTLLDTMSRRIHGRAFHTSGSVTINDRTELLSNAMAAGGISAAYVKQQDVLLPTLTVRETLQYAADLRLPAHTTKERNDMVDDVIMELGLKSCANTRIGNNASKSCSGGEKRRTSVGVQLLANQSVLFLDEPTTGLDTTSAFQLVQTLKNLARKGRTIIMTSK